MASHYCVHVRVVKVSGLLECTVCSGLTSFNIPFKELDDRVDELRCATCKGSCVLVEGSVHPELEIVAGPGGEPWPEAVDPKDFRPLP